MGDVADCFAALIALPLFTECVERAMGRPRDPVTLARLCVLAYLHDLGKLSSSFQAKASDPRIKAGHSVQGWHVFAPGPASSVTQALAPPEIRRWGSAVNGLFLAALAHHGRPVNAGEPPHAPDWGRCGGYDPVTAAAEIGQACRARFPAAFGEGPDLPDTAELQHFFAGLVVLAEQIGSSVEDFPIDRTASGPRAAAEVLRSLNLDVTRLRSQLVDKPAASLFGWPDRALPHAMQQALADLPLDIRLAVLEFETGSGKTEAAVLRFLALFAAGLVDGLYFALPTRAAASQIQRRIHRAVQASFGAECVLALPGYLKAGDATGAALPGWQVEWADDPDAARGAGAGGSSRTGPADAGARIKCPAPGEGAGRGVGVSA